MSVFAVIRNRPDGFLIAGIFLVFSAMPVLVIARARSSMELWDDRFVIRYLGRREYRCADFVGFRRMVLEGRYSTYPKYRLIGRPGQPDVSIAFNQQLYSTFDQHRFREWISRLQDLEATDQENESIERKKNLLSPHAAHGRILSRKRARKFERTFRRAGLVGVLLILGVLYLRPALYSAGLLVFGLATCLVLPAAVWIKIRQPEAFQLGTFRGAALPASVAPLLFFGAIAPIGPALVFFAPANWVSPIWKGVLLAAIVAAPLFLYGLRRVDRSPGVLTETILFLLVYGYSSVVTLNGALDRNRPLITTGVILDKSISHGRQGTRYILTVELQRLANKERDLAVPRPIYDRARIGDGLGVYFGPGALGVPWIVDVFGP